MEDTMQAAIEAAVAGGWEHARKQRESFERLLASANAATQKAYQEVGYWRADARLARAETEALRRAMVSLQSQLEAAQEELAHYEDSVEERAVEAMRRRREDAQQARAEERLALGRGE